ncbi:MULTISPECIES: pilus assembly protein [Halomonas]|uniref:pilus assembly protein n=1 Tax=Halomonas TaxID=2745 RepID=UPI00141502C0|nr:PilC/PilY family type IV pilus protein [Halomonas ventosae]
MLAGMTALLCFFSVAYAQSQDVPIRSGIPYLTPSSAQAGVTPRSMVVMSNDHQLFFKAYTDWSDIDGDGVIDDSFKPDYEYYGYFDSNRCYVYADNLFKPAVSTNANYVCPSSSGLWSGNFLNWLTMTRMDILRKVLYGGKRVRDTVSQTTILERAYLPYDAHSFVKVVNNSSILSSYTPLSGQSYSFCNTTGVAGGYSGQSKDVDAPPQLRVAAGKWPNWAANERWQCVWADETGRNNGNDRLRPESDDTGSATFDVRVEACPVVGEGCTAYPDSSHPKPTGLLHEYARSINFGLMTGSYAQNTRGGVLRANLQSFIKEFDESSGVFRKNVSGIVSNIDAFRISRYRYSDGTYNNDNCPFGKRLNQVGGGDCSSWINPFGEITAEALRYLTGEAEPTSAFKVGEGSVETGYLDGLTSPAWKNEVGDAWCAASSMILINSSEVSLDGDDLGSFPFSQGGSLESWLGQVASDEGIGGQYFVGETGSNRDKRCTAKSLSSLTGVKGICPAAPGLEGTYNVAALTRYAWENPIVRARDDSGGAPIRTYAVRLTTNTPLIELPGFSIVPACENIPDNGKCALVDFRPQFIGDTRGEFEITWEVAEFGGDYDSDIEMTLAYQVENDRLSVTTDVTSESTSREAGVGYILSGSSGRYKDANSNEIVNLASDGFQVHSGIERYNESPYCSNKGSCELDDSPSTQTYRISASGSAGVLKPPLFYAAKYGSDSRDDTPENYFQVNRISELAESLRSALDQVLKSARTTGAGLGFSQTHGGLTFQTEYNNNNSWSGDLIALATLSSGLGGMQWSARQQMPAHTARTVITSSGGQGVSLSASVVNGWTDTLVDYLRGDTANEQRNGGSYRDRLWRDQSPARLGDMISSQPVVVARPNSYYVPTGPDDTSYLDYRVAKQNRATMVYVGANDGMLHGFDAATGQERLAYVPGLVLDGLAELASPEYQHRYFVDGSPTALDVQVGTNDTWRTVLVSGLGHGGRGLFALDVSSPSSFSEANANQVALFEYGPVHEAALFDGRNDHLGYIDDNISLVQLEDGSYAAVFANGFASPSGKAALYVITLDGAADGILAADDVSRLVPADAANAGVNGMTSVSLVDADGNGRVDTAYGGDLKGNLWRFNMADPTSITSKRLFSATDSAGTAQMITAPIEVGEHPEGGLMIFVGTGKRDGAFALGDTQEAGGTDSFYAIRDLLDGSRILPLSRDRLAERELLSGSGTDAEGNVRALRFFSTVTANAAADEGWFMDFPDGRERVTQRPLLNGKRLYVTSLIPGQGVCGAEDQGFLYELQAFKGQAVSLRDDGSNAFDVDTTPPGGAEPAPVGIGTEGMLYTLVVDSRLEEKVENINTVSSTGETMTLARDPAIPLGLGRVSWRELER